MSTTAPDDTRVPADAADPGVPGPGSGRFDLRAAPRLVRGLCLAVLVANATIVVTGAAVRLTGSGLGCPTWPRCTDDSYVNTPEYGVHGYIEFGNRLLTFVLTAVVLAAAVAILVQRHRRRSLVALAALQPVGIACQAVVGGITVRTGLNPWTVSAHFLVSTGLVYAAYVLWHRAGEGDGPPRPVVAPALVWLARVLVVVAAAVIAIGTVVTGSGPHAGDAAAARTGFDPAALSQLHADGVFLLVGLTGAAVLAYRSAPAPLRRAAVALLVVELAQGTVGFVQYATDLPIVLVGAHVAGACVLWVAALRVLFTTRTRGVLPADDGEGTSRADAGGRPSLPHADGRPSLPHADGRPSLPEADGRAGVPVASGRPLRPEATAQAQSRATTASANRAGAPSA